MDVRTKVRWSGTGSVELGPILLGDVEVGVGEGVLVGDLAEFVLMVRVEEGDEELFGAFELGLAERFLGLFLGFFVFIIEALVAGVRVGVLVVRVHLLSEGRVLFLMVPFIWAFVGGGHGNIFFVLGLGFVGRGHFWRVALRSEGQGNRSWSRWLLFLLDEGPLSHVVVELLEARHFVGQGLRLDPREELVPLTKIVNVLFGQVDAGRQLALVLLLGLREEGREVLLDQGKLLVLELPAHGARCGLVFNHWKVRVKIKND